MGWTVTESDGQRTTKWIVPESAAGWHVNSVGAGAAGNLILSGHQVQGDAVFAPLSLGDIAVGQEILIEDEEGVLFVYQIVDVSEPIPATGATEAEVAQALEYLAPTDGATLTMITGWPDFTTTHRVFARAELLGVQK
jgi:sortase (surface protein transpeptidase)